MRPNSHGDRQDRRHSNRNSSDEKHQEVVNSLSVPPVLDGVHHYNLDHHPKGYRANAEITNGGQNLSTSIIGKENVNNFLKNVHASE